jgi:hypothetical protein
MDSSSSLSQDHSSRDLVTPSSNIRSKTVSSEESDVSQKNQLISFLKDKITIQKKNKIKHLVLLKEAEDLKIGKLVKNNYTHCMTVRDSGYPISERIKIKINQEKYINFIRDSKRKRESIRSGVSDFFPKSRSKSSSEITSYIENDINGSYKNTLINTGYDAFNDLVNIGLDKGNIDLGIFFLFLFMCFFFFLFFF